MAIIKSVKVSSRLDLDLEVGVDAAVDSTLTYLTLPISMKSQLGALEKVSEFSVKDEDGLTHSIEGFNAFYSSVEFVDAPKGYAPRIGHTALSQSLAVIGSRGYFLIKENLIRLPGMRA